jgi:hypothetical protein
MGIALEDLALRRLYVIHAGMASFPISKNVSAVALQRIESDLVLD